MPGLRHTLSRVLPEGPVERRPAPAPYLARLEEHSPRGRYILPTDAVALLEHLPAYVRGFFALAYDYGTRKGQLARTLRRYVDLRRGLIEWPPAECKHKEAHVVPLEGE